MVKKKLLNLSLIIAISPFIGGLYGILNDQFTYTISPEYFTKFKFIQFGFIEEDQYANEIPQARILVAGVGFFATWWMGLIIGTILGLVGLTHLDSKKMFSISIKAIFLCSLITFIMGVVGLFYGFNFLAYEELNWSFPPDLVDKTNFIAVGSMHNFSYFGGLIGLLIGSIYSIKQRELSSLNSNQTNAHSN